MRGALFDIKQKGKIRSLAVNAKNFLFAIALTILVFHISFARAEMQSNVILAAVNTKVSPTTEYASYPKLFGKQEQRYSDISAFTKWSEMFVRFQKDVQKTGYDQKMKNWDRMIQSLRHKSLSEKIAGVNDFMNRFKFVSDDKNWQKRDYWATPIEFMAKGGDCEDYAIAKYVSLRALGVDEDKMRIAIVQDQILNIPHAVLVVYDGDNALILDNQSDKVIVSSDIQRYQPIYSISQTSWWRH